MSFSDSESSAHGGSGGEYKFFRQISRDRKFISTLISLTDYYTKCLDQPIAGTGDQRGRHILIMDKVTVKVMSHSCKMADITDQGISLVEDLFRRRQPMTTMDAVYFIQPSKENIVMFLSDMSGREPLYKKAFVFFCSPIPKDLVNHIKSDVSVLPRIGALREMNFEYFPIDSQGFVTDHDGALKELYGKTAENTRKFDACLNVMATRIATVFASLKEFPCVRYHNRKSQDDATATFRDLVPSKLANAVWNCIEKYKSIPNFPQTETCDLLIVDRSIDQVAPIIHEWTYDAMCHDLLDMDGNKFVVELPSKAGGKPEKKDVVLDDNDPVWLELRHAHIADASERLHDKMTNLSKNKAAQMQSRDADEISTRDLQKIVQALPKYNEQVEKLSLHVEKEFFSQVRTGTSVKRVLVKQIAGRINRLIRELDLRELGQLEQDLVFGDAGAKEVINFLRVHQDASPENKLRLLMIYACLYPEKFEGDKGSKLMQLAKLSSEDMKVITNMQLLGAPTTAKKTSSSGAFSLKFDNQKTKHALRKDRTDEEETWQLFRFYPVLEELIEKLNKGELPKDEYTCLNQPIATATDTAKGGSAANSGAPERKVHAHSKRSRRTSNWARPHHSDDGYSSNSVLKNVSNELRKLGQRVFVFIIGGATRSELRVCHKLTSKLRREVILGSSSFDDPPLYVTMRGGKASWQDSWGLSLVELKASDIICFNSQ
ncbi:Protein transport Sec1a [Turnera subulata]|uniref:Protein transport Sec1a n=1 Tax=Turnera subulata TaxID=218843 RepID=A0A9Q0J2E0_9ROSI|nr:Protein transport Sec1a [Turnera subulata]